MAAIVSGSSLGLLNSSLYVLGSQGALGQPTQGRAGEQVFVNGSSGNLVIQNRDELVIGRGPDLSLLRTYNSQGLFDGDNNDNWRFGVYRKVYNLTGTVNTAGSTVTRVAEDGSESVYTFDATLGKYVCHDGGGSFDTLSFTSATQTWTWSWTDGTNQLTELYDNANGGRITRVQDQDGNGLTFTYNATGLITQVSDANGESTFLDYTGTNLTQLRTVNSAAQTLVRTRYAYDASNRLITVTTDLSPEDASIADGKTYVVSYTYDGTSKRVATLTQTDGNNLSFTYIQVGTAFKLASYTDAAGKTTSVTYTPQGTSSAPATAAANNAVLSTTDTQTTDYSLNSGALTNPAAGWTTPAALETSSTAASGLLMAASSDGAATAVWLQGGSLYASSYNAGTHVWSAALLVSGSFTNISGVQLDVDQGMGDAIVTWIDTTTNKVYANRLVRDGGVIDWKGAQLVATATGTLAEAAGAINKFSDSAVMWRTTSGTTQTLMVSRWNGTAWGAAEQVTSGTAAITAPQLTVNASNLIQVVWRASDGTAESLFTRGFFSGAWGATHTVESSSVPVSLFRIDTDQWNDTNVTYVQGNDINIVWGNDYSGWNTPQLQVTSPSPISQYAYSDHSGSNVVAWITTDGKVYANRFGASGAYLLATGTGLSDISADVNYDTAIASWRAGNDLYVSTNAGAAWSTPVLLESASGAAATPKVVADTAGEVFAVWQQNDGTANSIFASRYVSGGTGSPYYTVQASDTWGSVAQLLYGSSAATSALQQAMGGAASPTPGPMSGFPATLSVTSTTTVPAYYAVRTGDTWASIAQTVYGDAQAGPALQTALNGGATPTVGAHLIVPQSLSYTKTVAGGLRADITDPLGLVTSIVVDGQGQITQILNPAVGGVRQSASYAYDANGNVASVTDARGLVTTYGYDANGNRVLERDAAGNTITRVFSSGNLLLAETSYVVPDPDGAGAGQPGTPLTARYAYDSLGHLRFIVSAEGRVSEYRYNSFGQRIAAIQYTGSPYNLTGLTPTSTLTEAQLNSFVTAADKTKTERIDFTYDLRGQLQTTISYGKVDAAGVGVNDTDKAVTNYVYDQAGNLLNTVDGRGSSTAYVYDGMGRLKQSTDATGRITTTFYDDANKKTVLTSANGLVTTSTYDAKGELISVLQSAGAQGLGTTSYFYDADGRLRRTVDPTGVISHILYDEAGRRVATIDGNGTLTEYRYDADSNLTRSIQYATAVSAANLASLSDAQGTPTSVALATIRPAPSGQDRSTSNVYNSANRLVKSIDELGFVTQYFYDGAGRQTDTLHSANAIGLTLPGTVGSYASTPDSAANSVTGDIDIRVKVALADWTPATTQALVAKNNGILSYQFEVESGGLLSFRVSPDGAAVAVQAFSGVAAGVSDGSASWLRVTRVASSGAAVFYTSADYNPNTGNGTWTQLGTTTGLLAAGNIFDSTAGVEIGTRAGGTTDPVNGKVYYAEVRNGIGGAVAAKFDPLDAALSSTASSVTSFVSGTGETWSLTGTATLNTASANDRLTRSLYDGDGKLRGTLDGEGYLVEYKYDAAGQLIESVGYSKVTDPSQRTSGTLAQLIPTENATEALADIHSYTLYNAKGQVVGQVDGEGYLTESVYDLAGNSKQVIRYATKVVYTAGATLGTLRPGVNAQDRTSNFTYTALNQLASASDFEGTTTSYTYDEVGNLTQSVKAVSTSDARTSSAQYDKQGRLTAQMDGKGSALLTAGQTQAQIDAVFAANATRYTYDTAGRRTSSTDANGNKTLYYYDADGHLTHAINAAGEVTENQYNVLGQLKQSIAYGTRLSATTLGTLSGGLVNTTLTNAVTLIANAALDSVTGYTYTARGQVASSTDALQLATTNTYDAFGDLTGSSQQIGAGQTLDHSYAFDRRGLLTQTVWDPVGTNNPAGINSSQASVYDAFGRSTQTTDANGNVRTRSYDRLGRTVSTTLDPGAGHLAIGTSATYDAFDRVLTQTDALGNATSYTYSSANRSVTMTTPELVSVTTVHNRQGETQSVTDGRGNVTKYDYDLDGNLKQVSRTNAQGQVITSTLNTYDKGGRLTDAQDAQGNLVRYTYDAANRVLTRVVNPGGLNLSTTYEYNARGLATKVTDARNIVTQTEFDLGGRTTRVTVDAVPGGLNLRTFYAYDGRVSLTVTEGEGSTKPQVTKYTYDKLGRRIQEQVDPAGLNLTTSYAYDKKGNLVAKTEGAGKPEARTTRYAYDAADRLVWTVDALGEVGKNEYDADGRVMRTIAYATVLSNFATLPAAPTAADITSRLTSSAADEVISHVYDKDGREVYTIDAMGDVTLRVYDNSGNVIQTTAYAAPITVPAAPTPAGVATLVSTTDPLNHTTRSVYDALGRATFVIDAAGYVTQRIYDGNGKVTKQIQYANALRGSFTPNAAPQLLTADPVPAAGSWVIVDAAHDQVTRQIYDAAGRMRFGVDAEGYVTERRLDGQGNEIMRIRYADKAVVTDSTATESSMAGLFPGIPQTAVKEEAHYDNAGRLFEVVDAEGSITRTQYDAVGNKTDVIRAYGTSLASTTHYVYDAAGRETEETAGYGSAVAGTTRYVLDAFGNRTGIIDPRGVELAEKDTAWAQGERARLGYLTLAASLAPNERAALLARYTTTLAFDKAGRKTSATDALGGITRTVYDAFGNAVKITDPRGNSGYFYFDANNRARFHVDPLGYATEQRYDAFGNVRQELRYINPVSGVYNETTAVGVIATRTAAAASIDDRQTTKDYDRVGQVTTITYQGTGSVYTETFQYDAFGNKTQYKDKSDAVYNYEYDLRGHVKRELAPATDVVTPTTTLNTRVTKVYEYDAFGNRTKMTEAAGIAQVERFTVYGYDKLGRQTHIQAPGFSVFDRASGTSTSRTPATDNAYDAAGNLVMESAPNGRTLNYYDAVNRKVASVDAENFLREYEYDAAGNLVRERRYETRLTGTPTWQARPAPVNPNAYREMRYSYDANNLRTGTQTRTETLFSYALLQSTGQGYYDAPAVTSVEYNANGDIVKTVDGNGNKTYQFYDTKGNRILQIDPLGYAIRWEYNSQGEISRETRYASALPAATLVSVTAASSAQTLIDAIPGASTNPDNRVTEYTYDRLGRVTLERKKAVGYAAVDTTTGKPVEQLGDLDTRYEYDGNGKIKAVVLPNAQGRTDYAYDALGRRMQELGPQFQAFNGRGQALVTTREETRWAYDAYGDVAAKTQLALTAAEDRQTRYSYDSAGRLRSEIGPEGATISYDYDINGNVLRRSRQVTDVDNTIHTYRTYYVYDALNRETSCQDVEDGGMPSETKDTRYNAYGDVEAKGINGTFQEQFKYDNQGHLFWTNEKNGTPRLYVYDADGNAVLEVQAKDTDLSTVAGPSGPIAVTSPAQVRLFSPLDVQMTITLYDARNQITDVFQPPMEFADLISTPTVTTNGTQGNPTEALTNLALYQAPGAMNQVSGTPPPTTVPPLPPTSLVSQQPNATTLGYGSSVPNPHTSDPVAVPLGALGLTLGTTTPPPTLSPVTVVSDTTSGNTRTVVDRFTKTTVSTNVSVGASQAVLKTVTTTVDTTTRTTTFTRTPQTDTYGATGESLTSTWTDDKHQNITTERSVNVTQDQISWVHTVDATTGTGWVGSAGGQPGVVAYSPPGTVSVQMTIEADNYVDYGEAGIQWNGYYYVNVYVPPINWGGADPVVVTNVWENGSAVVRQNLPSTGNAWGRQLIRYDGHGIYVTKGNVTIAAIGMDRTWMGASAPVQSGYAVVAIKGLKANTPGQNDGAASLLFSSREGSQWVPKSTFSDGSIEFDAMTHLNLGDSYDYDVYDGNGSLLNRVHGVLGDGSSTYPISNNNQYKVVTTDKITQFATRLGDSTGLFRYVETADSRLQNNYLKNLVIQVGQGSAHSNAIHRSQSYDAFGEVISETDGNGYRTDLAYNDLGKLILKQDPTTDVAPETGASFRARPTTRYYYDELGQLVGSQDPNSYLLPDAQKYYSTRVLVSGRVEREFDAYQNSKVTRYDRLGNQRLVTSEIGLDTEFQYDHNGRLTRVTRYDAQGLQYSYDAYQYDLAGNRIAHTDALGQRETYLYDGQGRIRRQRSFALRDTFYDYSYLAGIGGIGGYEKRTRTAAASGQDILVDQYDYFGKIRLHQDLSGETFNYFYNNAGWLKEQTGTPSASTPGRAAQHITYSYYQNGYLKTVADTGINSYSTFQYDRNGNRTAEAYSQAPLGTPAQTNPYQIATAVYDELNRVKQVGDQGRFGISYAYDANGNRRSIESTYLDLLSNTNQTQNFYYTYDRMNRFLITMGQRDASGAIVRGTTGYQIEYDALSRRKTVWSDHAEVGGGPVSRKETYTYDPINTVKDAYIEDLSTHQVRHTFRSNDAIGRLRDYTEYDANGNVSRTTHYDYDADNLKTLEDLHDAMEPTETRRTTYNYVGNGILDSIRNEVIGAPRAAITTLAYAYEKWDSYKESTVTISATAPDISGWQPGTSTYAYDANGHIAQVFDSQAHRTLAYVNNYQGLALRRYEIFGGSNPATRFFYSLNGIVIGDVGTDKVPSRVDYAQSLADYDRQTIEDHVRQHGDWTHFDDGTEQGYNLSTTGIFRESRSYGDRVFPVTSADFDQNYQPINDAYPGHTAQSYVTHTGDSLGAIALAVWGDASLWYLLADANGLTGTEQIPAGTRLTIPNVVTNIHNNAKTFRPYDPGLAMGDTTPTLPDPPPPPNRDSGCGGFGFVLVMVVVIVVAAITEQWYLADMAMEASAAGDVALTPEILASMGAAPEAGVVGAAAGNLAGQAVANIIGIQHGFSVESFVTSVASAGFSSAIGSIGSGEWGKVATAVLKNAVNQGVNVITGQQEKFDWRGVAAAGFSAVVAEPIGKGFANLTDGGRFAYDLAYGAVSQGINVAAHRGRERFNFGTVLGTAYGNAIGASLADQLLQPQAQLSVNSPTADSNAPDTPLGGGLRATPGQVAAWGPQFNIDSVGTESSNPVRGDVDPNQEVAAKASAGNWITVQKGDMLERLAGGDKTLLGGIMLANGISDANRISAGQPLFVPNDGEFDADQAREVADRFYREDGARKNADAAEYDAVDPRTGLRAGPTLANLQALNNPVAVSKGPYTTGQYMTAWDGKTGEPTVSPGMKMFTSAVGMVSDGLNVLAGAAITGTGASLTLVPEPTTLTKWAGVPLMAYGAVYTGKSAVGFGLNATNFALAWQGYTSESAYMPGSALEWVVRASGGTPEQEHLAMAADMLWGLKTERMLGATLSTGAIFKTDTAALLQAPLTTTVERQAQMYAPSLWQARQYSVDYATAADALAKGKEGIYDPLKGH